MSCAPRILICALLAITAGLLAFGGDGQENAEAARQPMGLWLPWEAGTSWRLTNGPHGTSSDGYGAALDLQPPDAAGVPCERGFSSAYWVVAAAGGRVLDRANGLEIDHGNGLRTGYLHLQEKQVTSGPVDAGDRLGKVSCCPDGGFFDFCWATAPHLHFYTVYNGAKQGIVGINIEGWVVQDDGCLLRGDERVCLMGWLTSGAPAHTPSNAEVVLILDATGDNATGDPQRARLAAARAFLGAAGPNDRVSIVTYNATVHGATHLREAKGHHGMNAALLRRIDRVGASGDADLRVGIRAGCRELRQGNSEMRAAVLITDGIHDYAQLGHPQQCFRDHGWPVYAVAVAPGGEETLKAITDETGGQVLGLNGVTDIACEMYGLRMMIGGEQPGVCRTEAVFGEKTSTLQFEVGEGQGEATFAASWLRTGVPSAISGRTRVEMKVESPSGRAMGDSLVARGDLKYEGGNTYAEYALLSPEAGVWSVRLTGIEVPPEGVPVTVAMTTKPAHPSPPAPESLVAQPTVATEPPAETPTPTPTPSDDATPEPTETTLPKPKPKATIGFTPTPSDTPAEPTAEPTPEPTPEPTSEPTPEPTPEPTAPP
ncbi:MAG TPA: VWA domain-containing protein [Dehalococcoidia bacterium]|jgi:hypothetical protein|nr:VWA domain-containing protein [Dehalococcoidia bacterium]